MADVIDTLEFLVEIGFVPKGWIVLIKGMPSGGVEAAFSTFVSHSHTPKDPVRDLLPCKCGLLVLLGELDSFGLFRTLSQHATLTAPRARGAVRHRKTS